MPKKQISLTVNGRLVEGFVEPRTLLIHFIREQLNLTGAHIGCDTGHCGACTVEMDNMSVKSCMTFALQADGSNITTIEGVANPDGTLSALQEGFRMMHGLQCGKQRFLSFIEPYYRKLSIWLVPLHQTGERAKIVCFPVSAVTKQGFVQIISQK